MIVGEKTATIAPSPVEASAPSNIALCKYWGKRNDELNLPVTSSLSLSLGSYGSRVALSARDGEDVVRLNGQDIEPTNNFARRVSLYLDLFRHWGISGFEVDAENTIPTAAGLASSASGFAALARAVCMLHGWTLSSRELSILSRLGSGSAARSVYGGLVEWHAGQEDHGMDSFAEPIDIEWPELRMGIVLLSTGAKSIGSREAMKRTVETSPLYAAWPQVVARDLEEIKVALREHDFDEVGSIAERNAMAMHATMMATTPPVVYWLPETVSTIRRIQELRTDGMHLYFTMDAGPNVKVLYRAQDEGEVSEIFPGLIATNAWE